MNTKQMDQAYVANTYGRFDVALTQANGAVYTDENGKNYIYGVQYEGETYGCSDLNTIGQGNILNPHSSEDASKCFLYYCECGKVEHETIVFNTEVEPVHKG